VSLRIQDGSYFLGAYLADLSVDDLDGKIPDGCPTYVWLAFVVGRVAVPCRGLPWLDVWELRREEIYDCPPLRDLPLQIAQAR